MVFTSSDAGFGGHHYFVLRVFRRLSAPVRFSNQRLLFRQRARSIAAGDFRAVHRAFSRRRIFDFVALRQSRRHQGFSQSRDYLRLDFNFHPSAARARKIYALAGSAFDYSARYRFGFRRSARAAGFAPRHLRIRRKNAMFPAANGASNVTPRCSSARAESARRSPKNCTDAPTANSMSKVLLTTTVSKKAAASAV